jgi:peptidylprolyl isomerase
MNINSKAVSSGNGEQTIAKAQPGDTVTIHFTCKLEDGTVFDTSAGREPLNFTIGKNQVIPSLEMAVAGMSLNESKTVRISAANAYGAHQKELVSTISREKIPSDIPLEVGMQLHVKMEDGSPNTMKIIDLTDSGIIVDANHPLADKNLIFDLQLLEITPGDVTKSLEYFMKGVAFQDSGSIDEAVECYKEAIKLNPNHAEAHYNLAVIFQKKEQLDKAKFLYLAVISLKPEFFQAYLNLGIAFLKEDKIDEAINFLQEALEIKPDYAECHYFLGKAFRQKNNIDEAIISYKKALDLNPDIPETRLELEELVKLRN